MASVALCGEQLKSFSGALFITFPLIASHHYMSSVCFGTLHTTVPLPWSYSLESIIAVLWEGHHLTAGDLGACFVGPGIAQITTQVTRQPACCNNKSYTCLINN